MAGPLRKPRAKGAPGTEEKRFALRLSLPAAAVLGVVLAVAVGWSFFMGFMVGRGQNPEARVEQMTGLGPETPPPPAPQEPVAAPSGQLPPESGAAAAEGSPETNRGAAPAPADGAQASAVPSAPAQPPQEAAAPPPGETAGQAYPFARPSGSGLAAWGITPRNNGAQPAGPQAGGKAAAPQRAAVQPAPPPAAAGGPMYDFVYQAAAFKNAKEADRLCAALNGHGLRPSRKKSGKVTLVTLRLRGTDADAAALRKTLEGMRLGAPVLLSRKVVTQAAPAKKKR
ncbi:SPOR domain-containing protein [uncultured Desulfovibrio sp.]|uniref:SPOR domain-containing protein n=1 Tax=uncultured Desulfovibrio sp. TaxID=167968 RepID=UPI002609F6D0|nr:SPOR domain-containing protein [uncultured Desulfovibrio sp.]